MCALTYLQYGRVDFDRIDYNVLARTAWRSYNNNYYITQNNIHTRLLYYIIILNYIHVVVNASARRLGQVSSTVYDADYAFFITIIITISVCPAIYTTRPSVGFLRRLLRKPFCFSFGFNCCT